MRRNKHERKKESDEVDEGKKRMDLEKRRWPYKRRVDCRRSTDELRISGIEYQDTGKRDGQKRRRWVEMVQNGPGDRVRG